MASILDSYFITWRLTTLRVQNVDSSTFRQIRGFKIIVLSLLRTNLIYYHLVIIPMRFANNVIFI